MKTMWIVACVVAALALLSGCAALSDRTPNSAADIAGEWKLTDIGGQPVTRFLPVGERAPTMTIDEGGMVSGFTGVNRMSGKLDDAALEEGRFGLGPMITTKMAGPGEAMAMEARFLDLLQKSDRASVRGDYLSLMENEVVVLKFERQ